MNQIAPQLRPSVFSIKILSGVDKGAVYQVVSPKISIGRSPDNDIVFADDQKVSRRHVTIDFSTEVPFVADVSGKNFIFVDGKKVKESALKHGSKVKIGDTELQIVKKKNLPQPQLSMATPNAAPSLSPQGKKSGGRFKFYTIIFGLGLFLYLFFSTGGKKKSSLNIRTSEEIMQETEESKKRQEEVLEARKAKGKNSRQYDEAQASYIRCFRDYRQGQFSRAIQYCQAALSLYPSHDLAQRYLSLSQRKRDEKIQQWLREGRLHRERGYFKHCLSTLQSVMYEIKDPSDRFFQEARQLHSECKTLMEGRY